MKQLNTTAQTNRPLEEGAKEHASENNTALCSSVVSPALADSLSTGLSASNNLIAEINCVIAPPKPLKATDVYVRAMLLVSDARNQHGGKFPLEELQRITELVIDTPVLVGHRKDRLPIARVFKAELIERDGVQWVKAYLYWLKETAGAETLRANIDGGVYKDCSLGFTFAHAECSICQADIRVCGHQSQSSSDSKDSNKPFHFYRNVQRALEISLVYRGANPGARVGVELHSDTNTSDTSLSSEPSPKWLEGLQVKRIAELGRGSATEITNTCASESTDSLQLTYPLLDGLPVLLGCHNNKTFVLLDDGSPAPKPLSAKITEMCNSQEGDFLLYARLIGMRGKSKLSSRELLRFLNDKSGPVRSLKLRALTLLYCDGQWLSADNSEAFGTALRTFCNNKRHLSPVTSNACSANNIGPSTSNNDLESLTVSGDGSFLVARHRKRPLVYALVSEGTNVSIPIHVGTDVITACESLSIPLRPSQCPTSDCVVALAFDRLTNTDTTPRLINPRIVGQFGAFRTCEILSSGSGTHALKNVSITAGVVSISRFNTSSELTAGMSVDMTLSSGKITRARIIHLKSETGVIFGLLATPGAVE